MNVDIPRVANTTALDTAAPPVYVGFDDGTVIYTCGGCGQWTVFAPGKTVDAEGNVTPSILCRSCGWHVFGRLLDWKTT
jgi:DNA-directed RNA polymerase subunit RPC12/RpoP